jgi:hypothetical protein
LVLVTANIASVKWNAGNARHKLKAMVSGERLSFDLDTALKLSATNASSPLPGGKAGLWASNGMDVHFDGVAVAPYFTDDFNSGGADDSWNELSGAWSVPTSGNQANMYKQSTLGQLCFSDRPKGHRSRTIPGGRISDEDNHFLNELQKSTNQLVSKKVVGGTETVIASVTVPALNYGETHTLHVDLQNNRQRVYMDGTHYINQSVYEPALASGRRDGTLRNARKK